MRHHDHEGEEQDDRESVESTMESASADYPSWHSLAHGTLFNIHLDI